MTADTTPEALSRADVLLLIGEAVGALDRQLRAEFLLASTPPAAVETEGTASNNVALASHALNRGVGSAAELMLALRNLYGPHTASVIDAVKRLGPQSTNITEGTK